MVKDCLPIQYRMVNYAKEIGAMFIGCQIIQFNRISDGEYLGEKKILVFEFSTRELKEERIYENFNSFQSFYSSFGDNDWVIIRRLGEGYLHQEVIKRLMTKQNDILTL